MSTAESTASADMSGGRGVRPYGYAENDGGDEDHGLACDGLLLEVLNEVHGGLPLLSWRSALSVFRDVLTKAKLIIVCPLHSLLKEIQEWMAVIWPGPSPAGSRHCRRGDCSARHRRMDSHRLH